jgi:hypothetical protein
LCLLDIQGSEGRMQFGMSPPDRDGNFPSAGTQIWVAVEIMNSGPHPCPYSSIATSFPWSIIEDVRQLGIKISWQE